MKKTSIRGLVGLAISAFVCTTNAAPTPVAVPSASLSGYLARTVPETAVVGPDGASQYRIALPDSAGFGWSPSGLLGITRPATTAARDRIARAATREPACNTFHSTDSGALSGPMAADFAAADDALTSDPNGGGGQVILGA